MARVMPGNPAELRLAGAPPAELETLEYQAGALGDEYTVFHAVHWMEGSARRQRLGEVDFCVVNAAGDVLLIEQKNGALEERPDGLAKDYGSERGPKSVVDQMHRTRDAVHQRLAEALGDGSLPVRLLLLLYCPDYRLVSPGTAGLPAEAMVDAVARRSLAGRIQELLGGGPEGRADLARAVRDFFSDELELTPDMGARVELHERSFVRLRGSLHELLEGLEMAPLRLRVSAAAGAGKSLLAARAFQRSRTAGGHPLLVCFNRPLADALQAHLGEPVHVDTFHGACKRWLEAHGIGFDAARARSEGRVYWPELVEQMVQIADPRLQRYDTLVVDEGQDFDAEWWEVLKLMAAADFDAVWVEDAEQALYERDPVRLEGFVGYRSRANFRTPARIARFIERLLGVDLDWRNPLPGMSPLVTPYRDADDQRERLWERVQGLIRCGFTPGQIAVVSLHGQQRSLCAAADHIGELPVRRFTGRYTDDGQAVWTEGEITCETIYRFKGQQAPAVVVTDIDLAGEDQRAVRLLYTALTRPTVACELLVQADSPWAKRLQRAAR